MQQAEPDPNFNASNFMDCHKNGSENSWTTAMLGRVNDSFGQILLFLNFLNNRWVQSKKSGKGKKQRTCWKKVFKLTYDWANLTANWASMNDNAEDIKENDQDV